MLIKNHTSRTLSIISTGSSVMSQIKFAADDGKMSKYHGEISRLADGNVDLVNEIKKHPEALWIRVKAIEADKENDNGDYFSREELLKSYRSFEGCPVFTNHENNKIEAAKGKVVKAEWNDQEGSVYCTMFIDRTAYPDLCRAIEEGYATDVSMGTQVDYSTCSVCENTAKTADDYCSHVKTMKGRVYQGKKVFEKNYGLKFIEISVVTDGACKDCTIREIIDPSEVMGSGMQVAANSSNKITKAADAINNAAEDIKEVFEGIVKNAGQAEIKKLNEAMDKIEEVTRTMLDQRNYIDLEFMSKVVTVLADLQHVTDELVDQGYGSVPSPGQQPGMTDGVPPLPGEDVVPPIGGEGTAPESSNPVTSGPSNSGVGSVTKPIGANSRGVNPIFAKRLQDLHSRIKKIYEERISDTHGGYTVSNEKQNTINKLAQIWRNPSVRDFKTEVSEGKYKILIGREEVVGLCGTEKIASVKIADLDQDVRDMIKNDPKGAGDTFLTALQTKVAEKAPSNAKEQIEETIELQLAKEKGISHARQEDVRESTTEKQLNQNYDGYDKHKRQDDPKHATTEEQLKKVPDSQFDRNNKNPAHEETMELQLKNKGIKGNSAPSNDGRQWAAGVSEQNQDLPEKQLEAWRKSDQGHNPTDEITEKQLNDQGEPWGRRIASKDDALKALTATKLALAKACIATGATPEELVAFASQMTEVSSADVTASKSERETTLRRASFHGRSLNTSQAEVKAYMLGAMADAGMTPEVTVQALKAFASKTNAAQAIETGIETVKASLKQNVEKPVDFFATASLDESVVEASDEATESIVVDLHKDEVGVEVSSDAFAAKAFEVATKLASQHGVEIKKNVHVETEGSVVRVTLAGIKKTEKTASVDVDARKDSRKNVVAQAPAGAPPAGGGAPMGGPGGTTMPAAMPGDPTAGPPVSSLGGDPMGAMGEEEEQGGGEAVPPGEICPACGSDEVDVKSGEFHCDNCGADGSIAVQLTVKNWPNVLKEKGPDINEGGEEMEEDGGLGDMAGGPGMEMPSVGVAASFKVTPEMVKVAGNKPIGHVCPHCGNKEVKLALKAGSGVGSCNKCSNAYRVESSINENKELFATVTWKDMNVEKLAAKTASSFKNEKKAKLEKALKTAGLKDKFEAASYEEMAKIIAELHDKGLL